MGVKNRILALKLIEKLDKKPEFKEEIKVEAIVVEKKRNKIFSKHSCAYRHGSVLCFKKLCFFVI